MTVPTDAQITRICSLHPRDRPSQATAPNDGYCVSQIRRSQFNPFLA